MKKTIFLILILTACAVFALAQEDQEYTDDTSVEMENLSLNNNKMISVPKGTRLVREGPVVRPEDVRIYVARQINAVKSRVAELEAVIEELKKEIEQLKISLSKKTQQE